MSDKLPKTSLIRIPPFQFLHVLDTNTNVSRLEVGPKTLLCKEHEKVVFGPEKMLIIPPRHYCVINNPVLTDDEGRVMMDRHGQARLKHGDAEVRFEREDPFPLYPGETLTTSIQQCKMVAPHTALHLRALRDFTEITDNGKIFRNAGDEWLFYGPATYLPRIEVEVKGTIKATVVLPNQAIQVQATKDCKDHNGVERKAGEMWLVKTEGAYIPKVDETILGVIKAHVLLDNRAIQVRALRTFTDAHGIEHKRGSEWLVTRDQCESYIPSVYEEVVKEEVALCGLTSRQYCVIKNPVDENNVPQLGKEKLLRGEAKFFLQPGESMSQINETIILGPDEARLVKALENFRDESRMPAVNRKAGTRWYVYGPGEYIPPLQVMDLGTVKANFVFEPLDIYLFYHPIVIAGAVFTLIISILLFIIKKLFKL